MLAVGNCASVECSFFIFLCATCLLPTVNFKLWKIPISTVSKNPHLYATLYGFHGHILFEGGASLKLYHGFIHVQLPRWVIQAWKPLTEVRQDWAYFTQPIMARLTSRNDGRVVGKMKITRYISKMISSYSVGNWGVPENWISLPVVIGAGTWEIAIRIQNPR